MYQWYDEINNVIIVYLALPDGVNECVTINPDGSYTIFISTQISEEKQRMAYNHAMHHINNDDFSKADVQEIEYAAHRKI